MAVNGPYSLGIITCTVTLSTPLRSQLLREHYLRTIAEMRKRDSFSSYHITLAAIAKGSPSTQTLHIQG